MVITENRFLIDASFIVEEAHRTFLGATLMMARGMDHTFAFGCVRDFLRLRYKLGIKSGVMVFGKEVYSSTSRDSIQDLISILQELKIPYHNDPLYPTLQLIGDMHSRFTHIVTADKRFVQFCTDDLVVVLPAEGKHIEWDWKTPDEVKKTMGIAPRGVPTYLALTGLSNSSALTTKQAIRLVELYGNLDSIYTNLGQVSVPIRKKLSENESALFKCYAEIGYKRALNPMSKHVGDTSLFDLDTAPNREVLTAYGFQSLLTLLAISSVDTRPNSRGRQPDSESYHAVVNRDQLQELESVVRTSTLCSIDTESDDKDPREATLLGISFSVNDGEAYFIPLIETDLKGLTKDDVLEVLRRIFSTDIQFIGHNIKYDCLILRRSGVTIRNVHFDTMLAANECHGDWPFFNLPYVCKRYLGKEIKSYSDVVSDGSTFLDLPFREMVNHACQDADITRRLYQPLMVQLQEKHIATQFFHHTMAKLRRLSNLEFEGVAVDVRRIEEIRERLSAQIILLRSEICAMVGRDFDPESQLLLSEVLREVAYLRGYVGPQRLTVSALEHLAVVEPVARLAVKVKRLRTQIVRLESISAVSRDGRIYPIFNQIKSRHDLVATSGPSIFDTDEVFDLRSCFDHRVRDLFVDKKASLQLLAEVTKDPLLIKVMARKSKVDPVLAKHPLMKELDSDELFLRVAVGQSDTTLSKRFLVDRLNITTIRHDLEKRYHAMFLWLNSFRRLARTRGYAAKGDLRKYIDGLRSSDVARRGLALEHAVRWLIRY